MSGDELFDLLRAMDMPSGHYAVFGSGPLIIRGIIEASNDLDVICRGEAWERAQTLGEPLTLEDGATIISTHDGAITFGINWRYGEADIDALIDTADIIDGLPFVGLEHVVAYKSIADRPKDQAHLAALEAALDTQ
jgi:hypothetical protein